MRTRIAAILVVAAATLLPRGLALDRLVTPDEHIWLARSANFYYALAHGQLGATLQYIHPGVSVMWAGAAAFAARFPSYPWEAGGLQGQWSNSIADVLQAHGYTALEMLVAGRASLLIAITAALLAAFVVAHRVVGRGPALVGFLLVALDPFHLALSRVLHVDALTSALMLLSVLALLAYLDHGRRRRDLLVSAGAAGLAGLTRSLALFLIPFAALLVVWWHVPRTRHVGRDWLVSAGRGLLPFSGWAAGACAVFVALWPVMWVDPVKTVSLIVQRSMGAAKEGHGHPLYFDGAVHGGDPGLLFYPVTYLWRTTPVTLAGLGLAIVALALPSTRLLTPPRRRALLVLLLYALLFTAAMSFGAKKFGRYLLPVYPALDLVAAVGWLSAARLAMGWRGGRARTLGPTLIALLVAVQAGLALRTYPYYFSYYNPLLGGTTAAPEVMMVGWGEGMDQVARYLNAQPDAEELRVLTRAWPFTLAYFFEGQVLFSRLPAGRAGLLDWAAADYYVLYVTETQRGMVPEALLDYLAGLDPVFVVRLNGLDYAWVYDVRRTPVPDYFLAADARPIDWGRHVRLVAQTVADDRVSPGEGVPLTLYVEELAARDEALGLRVRLIGSRSRAAFVQDAPLIPPAERRTVWSVVREPVVPDHAPPGPYQIEVSIYDRATGRPLPATDVRTGRPLGTWVAVGEFVVPGPAPSLPQPSGAPDSAPSDLARAAGRHRWWQSTWPTVQPPHGPASPGTTPSSMP